MRGEVRERPNRTVSKTVVLKGTVGSNPTLSATQGRPQNLFRLRRSSPTPSRKRHPLLLRDLLKSYRLRCRSHRGAATC
ncbi:hypothetical protein NSPZN2_100263 [Nitrospira defluvii]|uniref:Uncharacterized protein n=1 Tax=Nitrospira defluvii TaxID=330214 RepID=A0ABM8R2K8_9BACT|nr:hypothetical protein NSPZN2_100263 [Nitrospira defluvii]